jgi:hypothetical protein
MTRANASARRMAFMKDADRPGLRALVEEPLAAGTPALCSGKRAESWFISTRAHAPSPCGASKRAEFESRNTTTHGTLS